MSRTLIAVVLAGALAGAGTFALSPSGTRVIYEADVAAETSARAAPVCSCCVPGK
jgi:hypothetical protein